MITIPSLNNVTDILDTDMIMVTQQSGQSYKIAGSELNKRGKIIIANSTTITGAPLKAGSSVRVYFTVDLTAANASTTLQLNYNNVNYYVKAPKDGTLINFVATNLGGSPTVYKYLQKYTTLELLFDGTQFVIIGNPVILSSADYTIYADGWKIGDKLFCTINRLWAGAISDEDNHNLSDSIQNYTFLIVQMVTNQEYDYMILPVSSITLNQYFARTMMANSTTEVTLPFSYQSTCLFKFPSNTTIQNKTLYNNINYKLKVCNVWGIK